MIKVKDGYAKLINTTASGSASRVLLSNGGDHVLGNANGNIPLNNGTVSTNLNADMLDGVHASGLFTNLSNSGNNISITIGGTNKTLTPAYATKAGNADTVDDYHASGIWEYGTSLSPYNASSTGWYLFLTLVGTTNDGQVDFTVSAAETGDNLGTADYFHFATRPSSPSRTFVYTHLGANNNYLRNNIYVYTNDNKTYRFYMKYTTAGTWNWFCKIKHISSRGCTLTYSNTWQTATPSGTAYQATFAGSVNYATNASNIYVNQHTSNNTEYPLVWSNQTNTSSVLSNQLYKSYSHLTYNPNVQRITAGLYKATTGHFSSDTTLYVNSASACSVIFRIGGSEKARFALPNGYLGILTSSPSYPLHVSGDSYTTGWSRAGSGFYVLDKGVHYMSNNASGLGQIYLTSNEFNWSASGATLYFNYRASANGTTVTSYVWNAGSSSTYASHTLGALTSRGNLTLYGITQTCNKANDANYMNSALLIREYNFGGSQSDTWAIAPRLSWHWSGRVQTQIGLNSSGDLKLSKDNFATSYLLLHLGNSSVSGGGSSGGSSITVNIGNNSKTLTIPTSLPANGGNADTVDNLHASDFVRARGTLGTGNNYDSDWGLSMVTFDPIVSGTAAESNPNVTILNLGNNYNRRKQLWFNYSNNNIYYRRKIDSSWSGWVRLALASEIPTNTWRGITDSYSGTDSTISLSQKGGNALYNALVNGYASSAGSAGYTTRLYANSTSNLITSPGDYSLAYSRFQSGVSNIFPVNSNANGCITAHLHRGNYFAQIGLSSNGRMYYRTMMNQALDAGVAWKTVAFTSDIPSIPSISITNSGSGNAVTSITASGHTLTVTKGKTFFTHLGTDNKASVWSWGTVSGTSGWNSTASDRGYRGLYGTNLDISGFSTWYHRFAMCTDGRVEYWLGINTKTLTKRGVLAWTSDIGNGTVTIKQAGTTKGSFTMNQSGNTTIELTDNNTTYSFAPKGSATQGIYLSGTNTFAAMTYSLKATVNSGTASKLAYYSGNNAISAHTSTVGSSVLPIYLNAGVPTACSVPMVRYWATYSVVFDSTNKITKIAGNHDFFNYNSIVVPGLATGMGHTANFPSGYNINNTIISLIRVSKARTSSELYFTIPVVYMSGDHLIVQSNNNGSFHLSFICMG